MKLSSFCLGVCLSFFWSGISLACDLTKTEKSAHGIGENYTVSFLTTPEKIMVGMPFSILLTVCKNNGEAFDGSVKVTASMPAHGHGMNYKPSVAKLSGGKFNMEGFLFHMPGRWQYAFDLTDGSAAEKILINHKL